MSSSLLKYGGYHLRPSALVDGELTHVGPGTPGGEALRRCWQPIALASELGDVPLALRVLGEELVLFRDLAGRLGLLHRACSHRGASLDLGVLTERGLRCCYHGWLYDVDGTILETPAEPPSSKLRHNLCHGAYPVREQAGLVFAYLGPPDERPPPPAYDSWVHPPGNELVPFKLVYPCNWLQVHENTADPIHIPFLHGRAQFPPAFAELPALSFAETPLGLAVASTRWAGGRLWIRTADVMLPNVAQYPPAYETGEAERFVLGAWVTRWVVPCDDTSSWVIGYRHFNPRIDPRGQGRRDEIGLDRIDFAAQTAAPPAERQKNPGDYEAMVGQGPIAVHANEHLVASDRGVAMFRKMWRERLRGLRRPSPQEGPAPTYTCEVVMPRASAPDAPGALGEAVLRTLIASAAEPHHLRAARLKEIASCP